MEKIRTITIRKYYILSCHRTFIFSGNKNHEQSIILTLTNKGGTIKFTFTDLQTNEVVEFDNPSSGEYVVPLKKGVKTKLVITASKAKGSYKISKKTSCE